MSLYLGENLISGVATPIEPTRNIGQIVASTIPLTDAGLHLLDGSLISGSGSYADFVDYIVGLVNDYPDLFETEANWQASVTTYGVCGKFVYDSVNDTVRLPKLYADERYLIKSYSSGTSWYRIYSDGWCEQGGVCTSHSYNTSNQQVNFIKPYLDTNYEVLAVAGATTQQSWQIAVRVAVKTTTGLDIRGGTNADSAYTGECSWYTAGYVDISDYAVSQQYNYIVIATSTKTDIEVDIDEITTDLNGKVDKADLAEVHVVIETYQNGTDWYRLYDDGWVEQGGRVDGNATDWDASITYMKPFVDTNYTIICQSGRNDGSGSGINNQAFVHSFSQTGAVVDLYGDGNSRYCWWYACGYTS